MDLAHIIKAVSDAIENNQFVFAVLASVILYMGTQLWLSHSNHKQDRRNYEYERSKEVNTKRFGDELHAAEELSGLFMRLRLATHYLRCCPKADYAEADNKWRVLYDEAAFVLGKYAPVLNLRKQSDGSPTCGVHARTHSSSDNKIIDLDAIGDSLRKWTREDDLSTNVDAEISSGFISCRPSLYLRGIGFLDECIVARARAIEDRSSEKVYPFTPMSLYVAEDPKYCFMSDEFSEVVGFPANEIDSKLGNAYKHFVNCAFCRLRNSDTGQKDARRINRHQAKRDRRASFFPRLKRYERECPHPITKSNKE